MKQLVQVFHHTFFRRELELRVKLFNVLAIAGSLICIAMAILSAATGAVVNIYINVGIGLISVGLLLYSARSGRYQFCYTVSIICIFFILFPSMFFTSGGYRGGMPMFFVFAVVFTVYMLDGWRMVVVSVVELVFYTGLFLLAYCCPQYIEPFDSEKMALMDQLMGFIAVSVALGVTLYAQITIYKRQQKELEQAREDADAANRAKSAFLANMSHEIRTPIHIILGMNEIVHREAPDRHVRECSEKIDEASKMLLSLVNNVLDVSKIESGKMELLPDSYQSRELLDTLTLIGKSRCEKKGLEFRLDAEELPPTLWGDLVRIKQIFGNLLSNAAKYTEKGGVYAAIRQRPGEEENQIILCFSVQDTGIGIREEALPGLFDAFTCADLASHRHIEGTGLGLAIVKALTSLMGGVVRVESEFGVGSTFYVEVPQQVVTLPEHQKDESARSFRAPDARLLVVDDNEGNRTVIRTLLEETRIQVDTAESGEECLQMVRQRGNYYHLILMDYMMPGLNGLETLQELQKLPDFQTPVVALTANVVAGTQERLLKAGFAAFAPKPVPWEKMQQMLLTLLPAELVTIVETRTSASEDLKKQKDLEKRVRPYGIDLSEALEYFQGDLDQCGRTVSILYRYGPGEMVKAQQLWREGNFKDLRYLVHALKGKAKNMGMDRLNAAAARMETVCAEENRAEAESLMPYLVYLWSEASRGMAILERATARKETCGDEPNQVDPKECAQRLTDLLRQLRRRPSLECLNLLLSAEPEEEGKRQLEAVRDSVSAIDFETAEQKFSTYLQWKEGTKA